MIKPLTDPTLTVSHENVRVWSAELRRVFITVKLYDTYHDIV